MKTKYAALVGLLLAGCVPLWNPLYTEEDLVLDPRLEGQWRISGDPERSPERWTFGRGAGQRYQLAHTDSDGLQAKFDVGLLQLGEHRLLDLHLVEVADKKVNLNAWACFSLVPAHLVLKVEQLEPTLKMSTLNPSWLEEFLEHNPGAIAHRVIFGERVILTAPTKELQKFVLEHMDDREFFSGLITLKRVE